MHEQQVPLLLPGRQMLLVAGNKLRHLLETSAEETSESKEMKSFRQSDTASGGHVGVSSTPV